MARNLTNKCKQCRREGIKLFLKGERCNSSKCAIVRRNFIPGLHGPKMSKGSRLSGYGLQLREKQKAKRTYKILEKQFRNYFKKAIDKVGDTGTIMFKFLELRLDNAVYRAGFTTNRDQARQLVTHGHILINGKKVNIPSYQVKVKDKIALKPKTLAKEAFQTIGERLTKMEFPHWLSMDVKTLEAQVIELPDLQRNRPNFDLKLIIEFYSRQ
ncbi:MAG: 30S ribosomal protein S4 [Patescibacteria group bacterium]